MAAENGHKNVADLLLANKADVNAKTGPRKPIIVCGVEMSSVIVLWSRKGGYWDATLADGQLVTLNCVGADKVWEARMAAEKGLEHEHVTPLHLAAEKGFKDVTELLLANKADVNAKNNLGWTPLHFAAREGSTNVVELLLANKADINAQDNNGRTPLQFAEGHKDIVKLLRQNGGHKGPK